MKRIAFSAVAALLATPVPAHAGGGCHDGVPAVPAAATTIVVEQSCFGPTAARVAAGATVTWRNRSDMQHNVSGPAIDFAELPAGGTVTVTFDEPGLYPYACMIHAGMSGVVVVEPAVTPTAAATGTGNALPIGALGAGAGVLVATAGVLVARRRSPLPA